MRTRTTLFLLIAVALLGAYIGLVERDGISTDQRKADSLRTFRIEPEAVAYLSLEFDDLAVECQKEGGTWYLTNPFRVRADAGVIDRMLSRMSTLSRGEIITGSEMSGRSLTLKDYGLEEPRGQIVYGDEQVRHTLLIGRDAALGENLYIKEESKDDVLATETNLLSMLPSSVLEMRDHVLVHQQPSSIRRIDVSRPDGFLQLTSDATGRWMIQQPLATRADGQMVADLLARIAAVRIEEFVVDEVSDLSPYQLAEPAVVVSLWADLEDKAVSFRLADPPEDGATVTYAEREGEASVFAVPTSLLDGLYVKVEDMRDHALLNRPLYEVDQVKVTEREHVLDIERVDEADWRLVEPVRQEADIERVETFIMAWMSARIAVFHDGVVDLAQYGLDDPSRHVSFRFSRRDAPLLSEDVGPQTETVTVSLGEVSKETGYLYVRLDNETSVYEVAPLLGESVRIDPLHYRTHVVLSLQPEDIGSIRRNIDGAEQIIERGDEGGFVLRGGDGDTLNQQGLDYILALAGHLSALSFVATDVSDLAVYGLSDPFAVITFGLTGDAGISKTIRVSAPGTDGTAYGILRGDDAVFTLSEETVTGLLSSWTTPEATPGEEAVENETYRFRTTSGLSDAR